MADKEKKEEEEREKERSVDTGGGAYVGGRVDTGGGDFVGGDKISGDKVVGDKISGDKISVGDVSGTGIAIGSGANVQVTQGDTYSGDFSGAILNVRSTLSNVSQSIGSIPQADDQAKDQLQELVSRLDAVLTDLVNQAPEKADDAEAVASMTESLIQTASAEKPNKTILQITGEGLKSAAQNIADVMPAVLDIVSKIIPIVTSFAK